jgi:hypothetical protein
MSFRSLFPDLFRSLFCHNRHVIIGIDFYSQLGLVFRFLFSRSQNSHEPLLVTYSLALALEKPTGSVGIGVAPSEAHEPGTID